jgi:hypothetical protein
LQLQPCFDLNAQVESSLICTRLNACHENLAESYTALSCVWGDAKVKERILVNGQEFDITVNLNTTLRYIRDPNRKRLIWADDIYINQSDLLEKNQQVAQIGQMYQSAQHTIIFLGESTFDSDIIIDTLQSRDWLSNSTLPLNSMFDRPWFTRVWIFQELVYSCDP